MGLADFITAFGALLFVLALIWGGALLVRRLGLVPAMVRPMKGSQQNSIHITETKMLDTRRRLVVVQHGNQEHLLLLSPTSEIVVASNPVTAANNQPESKSEEN